MKVTSCNLNDLNAQVKRRLARVRAVANATTDLADQGTFVPQSQTYNINEENNYSYDEIGNLIKDTKEEILDIQWTVSGKVKKIIRTSASIKDDLEFVYDAGGNRVTKIVKPDGSSMENGGTGNTLLWTYTYYVRDAQGNIMATYNQTTSGGLSSYKLTGRDIYGSSRLGTDNTQIEMIGAVTPTTGSTHTLGLKQYEGVNHLGNVLSTFTDKKIPRSTNGSIISFYMPDVKSAQDYYPFGMLMPGRSSNSGNYRFGFNGKENDNEVKGNGNQQDYGERIHDTRLARFLSIDLLTKTYPFYSPYQFAGNDPTNAIDRDGLEPAYPKIGLVK